MLPLGKSRPATSLPFFRHSFRVFFLFNAAKLKGNIFNGNSRCLRFSDIILNREYISTIRTRSRIELRFLYNVYEKMCVSFSFQLRNLIQFSKNYISTAQMRLGFFFRMGIKFIMFKWNIILI